ncbi:MAG TPA: FMN-binding protein [Lachnospiraceae bacterium]|jgi:electron transport complex protein RnfG|nr:FMN-binding protein [Lachnospiraceae bacterium]HCX41840.1 FMN-binding protein [Lachnospiraceae bacterium]
MKQMMKDAMILFLITLISGAALGLVYEVTKEPIAQQEQKAKNEAYQNVFEAAEDFTELTEEAYSSDALTAFVKENGFDASIDGVAQALSGDGSVLGYVITVTDHEGYGGDIQFTMGVADDGTLNGISLLSISETAGLGMRAGEVLVPQFAGKQVEKFSYTKTGAASDDQIDAISGATITTNAVVNGVNAGLLCFQEKLNMTEGGAANE